MTDVGYRQCDSYSGFLIAPACFRGPESALACIQTHVGKVAYLLPLARRKNRSPIRFKPFCPFSKSHMLSGSTLLLIRK
ncbi:hypothetical protein B188_11000 [Candidatus Brocadiaceae bacterium B188]|nr:hypothetical protein B188_11000 [Candidatus Brocadiaceae bacterium B188]